MKQESYSISLPAHPGRLHLDAPAFKIVEASAKPAGTEFGLGGQDKDTSVNLLFFLFLVPDESPLSSEKCRSYMLDHTKYDRIQSQRNFSATRASLAIAEYSENGGQQHIVRAFAAKGELCADIEFYSGHEISADAPQIEPILDSVTFEPDAKPQFREVFAYATVLFDQKMFKAAAPIYEQSLSLLPQNEASQTWRRIATDQAVMAYGMSGDIAKSRSLLATAIKLDPKYPLNYYNLACADAEEGNAGAAKLHLQQAFDQKEYVIKGESLPDPTQDDSILKLKSDESFWLFVESLQKNR